MKYVKLILDFQIDRKDVNALNDYIVDNELKCLFLFPDNVRDYPISIEEQGREAAGWGGLAKCMRPDWQMGFKILSMGIPTTGEGYKKKHLKDACSRIKLYVDENNVDVIIVPYNHLSEPAFGDGLGIAEAMEPENKTLLATELKALGSGQAVELRASEVNDRDFRNLDMESVPKEIELKDIAGFVPQDQKITPTLEKKSRRKITLLSEEKFLAEAEAEKVQIHTRDILSYGRPSSIDVYASGYQYNVTKTAEQPNIWQYTDHNGTFLKMCFVTIGQAIASMKKYKAKGFKCQLESTRDFEAKFRYDNESNYAVSMLIGKDQHDAIGVDNFLQELNERNQIVEAEALGQQIITQNLFRLGKPQLMDIYESELQSDSDNEKERPNVWEYSGYNFTTTKVCYNSLKDAVKVLEQYREKGYRCQLESTTDYKGGGRYDREKSYAVSIVLSDNPDDRPAFTKFLRLFSGQ